MSLISKIMDFIFIPKCQACHEILPVGEALPLCKKCLAAWRSDRDGYCKRCDRPYIYCSCRIRGDVHRYVSDLLYLTVYHRERIGIGSALVLKMKNDFHKSLYSFMADEIVAAISERGLQYDVIVPVMRSGVNRRNYGIDQSFKLSGLIAERLGIPLVPAVRRRGGKMQKFLGPQERLDNAKLSYSIDKRYIDGIAGKQVFLLDDVVTTGATVLTCAELLRKNGAKRIAVLSIARSAGRA